MFTRECEKCGGKGHIPCFNSIAGGICFICEGRGQIVTKGKPQVGVKFAVSAVEKASGERVTVFFIKARTEASAIKAAIVTLSKGNGYIASSAQVAA